MIVYGDPHYETEFAALAEQVRTRLQRLRAGRADLDGLRALLIQAGQWEQAVADACPDLIAPLQAVTDAAARAFCGLWTGAPDAVPEGLAAMTRALDRVPQADPRLSVKLPEGFACYALYPEQYIAAARQWLAAHPQATARRALVVGVRSIGTTLSALVAATLRADGRDVRRVTVRPTGDPFARRVAVPFTETAWSDWALIVDEGPGLSGSSMAAAAEALRAGGLSLDRLAFLPGHAGSPGAQASEAVRALWAAVPRYVVPTQDLHWEGRSLWDSLAAATTQIAGGGTVTRVDDLGGGLWRQHVYADPAQWPAACIPFERPKWRVTLAGGRAVVWKFAGLADTGEGMQAEVAQAQLSRRAAAGWTPPPLGAAFGFVATEWLEGTPLTRDDAGPALLAHIGRYLAQTAGPPLPPSEQEAAYARLREMLYWNVWEALGGDAAAQTNDAAEAARRGISGLPAAGDCHLAPQEWLRTPSGRLVKTDSVGHDTDHTMVGRQPLAWAVAAVLGEWGLEESSVRVLQDAVRAAGGGRFTPAVLRFYRLAYAAFRVGQTSLCANMQTHDPDEQARLWAAYSRFRDELTRL